jgi:hypothetical protein
MSVLNVATGPATLPRLNDVIGQLPYRMAFAGGWIDQPFLSMLNPGSTGSMVTVGLQPVCRFMDRCGMGTSTRRAAAALWQGKLPRRDPAQLARELYRAENQGNSEPSGSQDMIGLIYPGVNRLDYDYAYEGGLFPVHVETNCDPVVAHWLEAVIYLLPINQRPPGYNPLGVKNLDTEWIRRLGQSGVDCYDAILARDAQALGASFNECMQCWAAILPHTVRHATISIDLVGLLEYYQARYPGAMYSGCGGGYLYIVSDKPVPGGLRVNVRLGEERE